MIRRALAFALMFSVVSGAYALGEAEQLDDPALESRARALSSELRCLVCQNESIDDSNADFARDMRALVRERLVAGDTDDEVLAYLVERYGEFVRFRPPLNATTAVLWLSPIVVVLMAVIGVGFYLRQSRRAMARSSAKGLSEDEEEALAALLKERR